MNFLGLDTCWKSLEQKKEKRTSYDILVKNYNIPPHVNANSWKPSLKTCRGGTWHLLWRDTNIRRGSKHKKIPRVIESIKEIIQPRMTWTHCTIGETKRESLTLSERFLQNERELDKKWTLFITKLAHFP